jgi:hypothetical protein
MSEVVNEVVAPVVAPVVEKAARRANVSDEAIITAWEKMAIRKDAYGVLNGSVQEVADELNMLKASLVQRVQSLKPIVTLTKMPRQKSTGSGGKKKNAQSVLDILARVRASLVAANEPEAPAPEAPTA